MKRVQAIALASLLLLSLRSLAQPAEISEIRLVGNNVTQELVIRREMVIAEGDPVDLERIERSRQNIMDLGLFTSVETRLEPGPEGPVLIVEVDEKFYILPIPQVDAQPDGDFSYGGELRFDNLFGLNQRLRIEYENDDSVHEDDDLTRKLEVSYDYPRVGDTPNNLSVLAAVDRRDFDAETEAGERGHYLSDFRRFRFNISRWLRREGPTGGWQAGGGMNLDQLDYKRLSGTPGLYSDAQMVSVIGNVGYYGVHDHGTYRSGFLYTISSELGVPQLGSDEDFFRLLYLHRKFRPLDGRGTNLNTQFRLGLANGTKFGSVSYSLGGDDSLRGYSSSDDIRGNAMLLLNVEYLKPMFGSRAFRGLLFADVGNAYPGVLEIDVSDLEAAGGFGFRWQVEWFVDVTLRAEMAWGVGAEEVRTYANTSRPF